MIKMSIKISYHFWAPMQFRSLGINGKSFNDSKIISKHKMKVYGEIFHLMKL